MDQGMIRAPVRGKVVKFISDAVLGYVEWAPGNGTVYRLLVNAMPDRVAEALGAAPGDVMVTLPIPGRPAVGYPMDRDGLAHESFIREKFEVMQGDLMAVTALINLALRDEKYGLECFEKIRDRRS